MSHNTQARQSILSFLFGTKKKKKEEPIKREIKVFEMSEEKKIDSTPQKEFNSIDKENSDVSKSNTNKNSPVDPETSSSVILPQAKKVLSSSLPKEEIETKAISLQKKEEETLEWLVLTVVERRLEDVTYQVKKTSEQILALEKEHDKTVLLRDAEKQEEAIKELIEKIRVLKEELEKLNTKDGLKAIYSLYYQKFYDRLDSYLQEETIKEGFPNQTDLFRKPAKEYFSLLDRILKIEKEAEQIQTSCEEQTKNFEKRDLHYEQVQDSQEKLDDIARKTEEVIRHHAKEIQHLEEKVEKTGQIIEKEVRTTMIVHHALENLILVAAIANLHPTPGNMILGAILVSRLAHNIQEELHPQKVVELKKEGIVEDFNAEISSEMDEVTFAKEHLDDAITSIQDLKNEFLHEFDEEMKRIPEFQKLLDDINQVEQSLLKKSQVLTNLTDKTNLIHEENNLKVKTYSQI